MNGQCVCGETTFEVELSNHDVHALATYTSHVLSVVDRPVA